MSALPGNVQTHQSRLTQLPLFRLAVGVGVHHVDGNAPVGVGGHALLALAAAATNRAPTCAPNSNEDGLYKGHNLPPPTLPADPLVIEVRKLACIKGTVTLTVTIGFSPELAVQIAAQVDSFRPGGELSRAPSRGRPHYTVDYHVDAIPSRGWAPI